MYFIAMFMNIYPIYSQSMIFKQKLYKKDADKFMEVKNSRNVVLSELHYLLGNQVFYDELTKVSEREIYRFNLKIDPKNQMSVEFLNPQDLKSDAESFRQALPYFREVVFNNPTSPLSKVISIIHSESEEKLNKIKSELDALIELYNYAIDNDYFLKFIWEWNEDD